MQADVVPGEMLCANCGYDLYGLEESRCPECGTAFDPASRQQSRIPWERRHARGRLLAYVQTVWWLTRRPAELGKHVDYAIDEGSAESFRRISVGLASVAAVLTFAYAFVLPLHGLFLIHVERTIGDRRGFYTVTARDVAGAILDVVGLGAICLSIWYALRCLSLLPSLFLRPTGTAIPRQNRGAVLSGYVCGVSPLAILGGAFGWGVGQSFLGIGALSANSATGLQTVVCFFGVFTFLLIGAGGAISICDAVQGRRSDRGLALLAAWLLAHPLLLVAIPWLISWLWEIAAQAALSLW